ncbi:phage integrase family protein (plasmid) [Corynebacterium mustelae]|uniref:Phage integrase family protein n=2 Tax=Corynebacterium mustelae TaxID=571915 RepID=A0A0G3GVM3_9CORY|nr:phage integrase family protein [Corynebacterium mustelae]AKK07473.1 phage integrase family protein [Corynebacterium mustelae]
MWSGVVLGCLIFGTFLARKISTMAQFGSIRKLPSGRWQARYSHHGGQYKAPGTFKTQRLAIAWLAEEEKLITFGGWTPPSQREAPTTGATAALTVGEWVTEYNEGLRTRINPIKPSTHANYVKVTENRITQPQPPGDADLRITGLAATPLAELTKTKVYAWWSAICETYDSPTVNQQAYKRLKAACAEAVEREMIPRSPVEIKEAGRRVKSDEKYLPTDAELHAILGHMNPRYKALTSLVLFHGLRLGEALALEQHHVRVTGEVPFAPRVVVRVEQNAQRINKRGERTYMLWQSPKTTAGYRDVPILRSHTQIFLDHLANYAPTETCAVQVFEKNREALQEKLLLTVTEKGAPMMDTSYRSVLGRAKERAGVCMDIDPHCGRNWLITRLAEQGAHLKEIGRLLGQEDISTILGVYMKVRAGRVDTLMDRVDDSL